MFLDGILRWFEFCSLEGVISVERQTLCAPLYELGGPGEMRSLSELRSKMHGEGAIVKRTRAVSARPVLYDNMPEERISIT